MADTRTLLDDGKAMWSRLTPGRRALILGAAVATLAGAGLLATRGGTEPYDTLYSGLAPEDAGRVVEALKAQNVPFRLENGGTTIEAPTARVAETRLLLAQAGLPRGGGLGYELFDKQAFGTSSFLEQVNYRRALQGELERSILTVEGIARARVHLATHERSLFKNDEEPSTASVVLALRPGVHLTDTQVRGVAHLVAASVTGLSTQHVTVVDDRGVSLWNGDEGSQGSAPEVERGLSRRVREMLERVVGPGHAQVVVTADVDATHTERTEEIYDKDRSALRSESRTGEGSAAGEPSTGGVAGAQGNLPGAPAPSAGASAAKGPQHYAETRNWEVTRVVNKTTSPTSRVRRLHVAVLVDGVPKDPADPKSPMVSRSAEELTRLTALAREAAGIDSERGDKIEVISTAFAPVDTDLAAAPTPMWWRDPRRVAPVAIAALLALIVLMLGLRAVFSKRKADPLLLDGHPLPMAAGELAAHLSPPKAALGSAAPRELAHDAIRQDAERAARVLSAWVNERREGSR